MGRLDGKVALISGGGRGMGATEARLFAREGAKVAIGDVLVAEGTRVAAEIAESAGDSLFVHLDVTDEDDWRSAVEAAVSRFGKPNVLINNAGIWRRGNVEDTTVEDWTTVMDINAKRVFLGTKLAIAEMRKAGGGSIINISSTAGLVGGRSNSAYTASKGAVRLLTKATAVQYGKDGIRANSIHPGPIDTVMMELIWQGEDSSREASIARTVLGRAVLPEDVAYGVLFLASDESSWITGTELVIDGGITAQ